MGEVEKPFSCPEQNCDMTFTNEDHLQVHRRRHEIQLTINTHSLPSASLVKHTGFLIDQTPTPTRFLRQCDEITLFQDINLNPFDYEFRKASQYRTQLSVTENHGSINGSLETPRIWPVDSDETISSTSRDEGNVVSTSSSLYPTIWQSTSHQSSPRIIVLASESSEKKDGRKKLSLNVSTPAESGETRNIISTPTPVITAGPSVSQALNATSCSTQTLNTPTILTTPHSHITMNGIGLGLGLCANEPSTPAISPALNLSSAPRNILQDSNYFEPVDHENRLDVSTSTTSCIQMTSSASANSTLPSVPPSPSATVLQLVLRLPNGESIPVEIPATPLGPTSTATTSSSTMSIAPAYQTTAYTSVINNPTPSLAKMKLKEALASCNTAARPGSTKHSRATTADRIAEMTRTRNQSGTSSNGGDNQDDSSSSSSNGTSNCKGVRRRRSSNPDETPEEKRRKFLERNRAAAVRCREKKKKLVQIIAAKSDELGCVNQKLLSEVSALRSEVASLKCLLLRHKNCPVTLAMKGEHDSTNLSGEYPQTFTTFKVQDPSGIITEVTTPITTSNIVNHNLVTQPRITLPKTVTFTSSITPPSPITNNKVISNYTSNLLSEKSHMLQSKLRKRSLSLSSISLPNSYSSASVVKPEVEHESISYADQHFVSCKAGQTSTSSMSFILNDSNIHTNGKNHQRIVITTMKNKPSHNSK